MAGPDDDHLVSRAREGDPAALDDLLRRHHDRIHGVCRRLTGNDADALDATQEALISIVRGLPRFDGRSSFSTWVYRIATNAALDELRRRRRRPVTSLDDARPGRREPAVSGPSVGEAVSDRLAVDAALAQVPLEFRAPVVLRDLCQLDYAEIAEVLDLPAGTVRSRISRGRAMLAARLADPGGNSGPPTDRRTPRP
ncbi:MAG: sigma-70 family RNA polymerase sigma factor [Acidimicrobiia bacterium]|nr:sigma-70 family RNA polymerase sigma factor [Acidimicrobiia bacterium]